MFFCFEIAFQSVSTPVEINTNTKLWESYPTGSFFRCGLRDNEFLENGFQQIHAKFYVFVDSLYSKTPFGTGREPFLMHWGWCLHTRFISEWLNNLAISLKPTHAAIIPN